MAKPQYDFSDFEKPKVGAPALDFSDFDEPNAKEAPATPEQKRLGLAFGAPIQSDTNPKAAESMLQGFGEQASFGYLPQLQGMAEVMAPNPNKELDARLQSEGFKLPQDPNYVQARDAAIAREESLKQAAPESFIAGSVGGALGGGAGLAGILGKAGKAVGLVSEAAKPAGLLARTGQAAGAGALQGGIQNPGDTQGEITGLQPEARLENAKTGAVLGAGAQLGLSALAKGSDLIGRLPAVAKEYAQLKAFKSAGAMLKDFRSASKKVAITGEDGKDVLIPRIQKIGQEMIDKGLVEPGATFKTIGDKAQELEDSAWKVIDGVYKETQKEITNPAFLKKLSGDKALALHKTDLNPEAFANDFEKTMKASLKGQPGGTRAISAVDPILNELRDNGAEMSLAQLQRFKVGVQNMVDYDRSISDQPLVKQELSKLRSFLSNKIQNRVGALDTALGGNKLASLKEANEQFGIWSTVSRIAKDRDLRENANRFMSLSDSIMTSGGMSGGAVSGMMAAGPLGAAKGAVLGAGAGLINKAARTYGNPLLIKGANIAGGAAGSVPTALPRAVGAGAGFLAQNPAMSGSATAGLLAPPQNQKVKP